MKKPKTYNYWLGAAGKKEVFPSTFLRDKARRLLKAGGITTSTWREETKRIKRK